MGGFAIRSRARRAARWHVWSLWPWIPLLFAGVYAILLATQFRSLVQALYLPADVVSAPVIAELYGQRGPGAEVVLGNFPWYTTLWLELLTKGLPHHRQVWQLAPWLTSLFGVGLIAWSAARVAGRWAAMVVVVSLACVGPGLLLLQFAWAVHSLTFVHVCLLGAALVWWGLRGGVVGGPWRHVGLCALLAAVTAAGVASDPLLIVAGLGPLALAGLAMPWLMARRGGIVMAVSAVSVSVLALGGGLVIGAVMRHHHVVATKFPLSYATFERIGPNVSTLVHGMSFLFNGDFSGARINAKSTLAFACAVVVVVAMFASYRFLRGWAREVRAAPPDAAAGPAPARAAYVLYWALAGLLPLVAYVVSSLPVDQYTARYVVTTAYALAALVPLAAVARGAWARGAVVVGVCVLVTANIASLVRHDTQDNTARLPTPDVSGPLKVFAEQVGVEKGYAGYWDAAALTWQTRGRVKVYPVEACAGLSPRPCAFPFHKISSWYTPEPGRRSFLILDDFRRDAAPTDPGDYLGRPERRVRIGQLTVLVYDYDIASRIGPPAK